MIIEGFSYRCKQCDFDLHPECVSMMNKYEGFEHLLSLAENKSHKSDCKACVGEINGTFFLRCVKCKINFHVRCGHCPHQLPPTIVDMHPVHPLNLITARTLKKVESELCRLQ